MPSSAVWTIFPHRTADVQRDEETLYCFALRDSHRLHTLGLGRFDALDLPTTALQAFG